MIVWDIETAPLPFGQISHLMPPFDGDVGEFDPLAVKCGNIKDPAKVQEKIEAARIAHVAAKANEGEARKQHAAKWHERCALSPLTGQVVAVGVKEAADVQQNWCDGDTAYAEVDGQGELVDEAWLIRYAWTLFADIASVPFVGHNIFGFDLPFLVRRSWLLGIDVPATIRNGRYWSPIFVDLMEQWGCGSREFISLDTLAKGCGIPGKPDGINGGDFARLLETDRQKALDYLRGDLEMTWGVASRMQIA